MEKACTLHNYALRRPGHSFLNSKHIDDFVAKPLAQEQQQRWCPFFLFCTDNSTTHPRPPISPRRSLFHVKPKGCSVRNATCVPSKNCVQLLKRNQHLFLVSIDQSLRSLFFSEYLLLYCRIPGKRPLSKTSFIWSLFNPLPL